MSHQYSKVLVVGSSGFLGNKIASEFLNVPQVETFLLVRKESLEKVKNLVERGATIVEGDILTSSVEELANLLKGVQVVVCAVTG